MPALKELGTMSASHTAKTSAWQVMHQSSTSYLKKLSAYLSAMGNCPSIWNTLIAKLLLFGNARKGISSHIPFPNQAYLTLDVKLKLLLQIETNRRKVELLLKGTAVTSGLAECCIWRILDISSVVKEVRQFKRRLLACLLLRNSFCYYDEVRRIDHT